MALFLLKRFAGLLLTLLLASLVVFALLEVLPGNAAQVMLGPDAAPEAVHALEQQLGLNQPAWLRYGQWLAGLAHGHMGTSHAYGSPVAGLIAQRMTLTVPLALLAMLMTAVLAVLVGVYAAARHRQLGDYVVMGMTQMGMAVPNFWFAILLILVFSVQLRWFGAGGFDGWGKHPASWLHGVKSLLLPALSLAVVQTAILARITRAAVLEVLHEDFVRTARARGAGQARVLFGHVLRNAMIPVLTFMGLQFANLLAGAVVVENVFFLPGLGRLVFQSIANRDLIVVRNGVMLLATMVIAVNFAVDLLHLLIDPRLRHSQRETPADAGTAA